MPNIIALRRRAAELNAEVRAKIKACEQGQISSKALNTYISAASAEDQEIADQIKAYEQTGQFAGRPGERGTVPGALASAHGFRGTAAQFAPLNFTETQLKAMHEAVQSQQSFAIRTKDFNTVDPYLPPELSTEVIGPQYETRLLERLPILPTSAPSVEFIRHLSTTGSPAITAEGAAKPELVFNTDRVILAVQKIACHSALSWESMSDWDAFTSYFLGELQRQVIDTENDELLNGDGTTGHLAGLLNTSGILTHATATETGLDAVELAIAKMRTGAALAEANLFVVHPNTWSAIRRTKDGQDRYLVTADPTQGASKTLWGVEVLPTTTIAPGVGGLLDTRKFGHVVVREALALRTGTNDDDFTRNLQRWIAEERLALAVERPAAVCKITGLPTA
ncbi:phage major capsid protein [Mycolicibacterium austroafricanum]|uniref:Phage major capsid protein n=1 Tax=Mycolicibacterium austroafricanum TaxID=39687 RepID=A0ABT8HFS7_MYCAO|nr:phage major capsid protein [Mycolicibacterium austroafricanum]MDN4519604.1 phage major capsid protein [Mycolicibacterium austroafricanum]QZT69851.1 phage major capsid protein [Mycolicibacterium austroafricanum]